MRSRHSLGAIAHLNFPANVAGVPLDGPLRDVEPLSRLPVGQPIRHGSQHLQLAFVERLDLDAPLDSGRRGLGRLGKGGLETVSVVGVDTLSYRLVEQQRYGISDLDEDRSEAEARRVSL